MTSGRIGRVTAFGSGSGGAQGGVAAHPQVIPAQTQNTEAYLVHNLSMSLHRHTSGLLQRALNQAYHACKAALLEAQPAHLESFFFRKVRGGPWDHTIGPELMSTRSGFTEGATIGQQAELYAQDAGTAINH
jgi:hypothetical protein